MDPATTATLMRVPPPQLADYWHIDTFVAGSAVSGGLQEVMRKLSLATEAEQQRIKDTLASARYPTLATRRLFFLACELGNLPLVELLCPMCDIESVDEYGKTALLHGASSGRLEAVDFLLDHGVSPLTNGSYGPFVRIALRGSYTDVAQLVLQLAGDCEDVSEILGANEALFATAVYNDQVDFATLLLAYGGTVLHPNEAKSTALLRSVRSVEMVELLYAHGADFGGNVGLEAVVEAMSLENKPLVDFFLAHGVDLRRIQY